MSVTRVRIFYPADPLGVVPGGIDTFIRGIIKFAPADLDFSLVGMTTDPVARPVGRFTRCVLGQREFDFFPAVRVADAGRRGKVPLSARYTLATARARAAVSEDFDVFDFHRIEPSLLFQSDNRPKNAFFHQDPKSLRTARSDILWKRVPIGYEVLESKLVPRLSSGWCVSEAGVATLKERYPAQADRFSFVPTWVDTSVFSPIEAAQRAKARFNLGTQLALDPAAVRIVSVGRLDSQKDPVLMLEAFAQLKWAGRKVVLLIVGDGVLMPEVEKRALELGLGQHVRFLGLRSAAEIANIMRASDMFALSSAYEGMPMAVLEALGCGLPVATTDVGEVRRVVESGVNGCISRDRSPSEFADCMADVVDNLALYCGDPATAAIAAFQPAKVLAPVYERYRELGAQARAGESTGMSTRALIREGVRRGARELALLGAHDFPSAARASGPAMPALGYEGRRRDTVVGAPIDVIGAARAREVILDWAKAHESRYVCFCNVHSAVAYSQDQAHTRALNGADLVAPDGAPIAWMLRRKGHAAQPRIDGPGTMWALCKDAVARDVKVGLYGSTPKTLEALSEALLRAFPRLQISYSSSPPFKPMTPAEDDAVCRDIHDAEVGLLFVALGCPKQERWMSEHAGRINAVMLGVGAAFDFHAGLVQRAPVWMQQAGLEWMHRVSSEPGRLWQRYLYSNSVFIMRGTTELARARARRRNRPVRITQRVVTPDATPDNKPHSRATLATRSPSLDHQHMSELLARVDASMPHGTGRVVAFIASGAGEGTSTLAASYAHTAATRLNRRVLLLGAHSDSFTRKGVFEAIVSGLSIEPALERHAMGYWTGSLLSAASDDSGWALAGRADVWEAMRNGFDEIVLDMPSSSTSRIGVMLASYCDGVIVVLEAEKTRAPVVEALVGSLQAVRANLLGTVMNKRNFHVPDALYRRL